jgi:DNA-binding transcriptional LysR family regulator
VHRLFTRALAAHEWTFESNTGATSPRSAGPILVDDADAMQEATRQHLGIAVLPDWNAAEGLRTRELEKVPSGIFRSAAHCRCMPVYPEDALDVAAGLDLSRSADQARRSFTARIGR